MTYDFTLPEFPDANFRIKTSAWTGKSQLWKDNEPVAQSTEKGKPFLVPAADGSNWKVYPKQAFPDLMPVLEINGIKRHVVPRLTWYEYAIGAIPFMLVTIGGALGGAIGAGAMLINYQIFRGRDTPIVKYSKVLGVILAAAILFSILAELIRMLL